MGPIAVFAVVLLLLVMFAASATTLPFAWTWALRKLKRMPVPAEGVRRQNAEFFPDDEADRDVLSAVWTGWSDFRLWVITGSRFYWKQPEVFFSECAMGFATATVKVPEAIALSFAAGVNPMQGLHCSFMAGLVAALLGGRPGITSGTCASMAVILRQLMEEHGPFGDDCPEDRREYVYFTVVLAGCLQCLFSFAKLTSLVRLIPQTAKMGFFNGLGVAIFISQLYSFRRPPGGAAPGGSCDIVDYGPQRAGDWYTLDEDTTWLMIVHVCLVLAVCAIPSVAPKVPLSSLHPRLPDCTMDRVMPPTNVAILLGLILEWGIFRQLDLQTPVVKDISRIQEDWPELHVPDVPWDEMSTWRKCLPYAAFLAIAGMVESQLTILDTDELLDQKTPMPMRNQETFAQGASNLVAGIFGGIGSSVLHSQTAAHLHFGARFRVSAMASAFFVMVLTVVFRGLLQALPTSALIGVMMVLACREFCWPSLALLVRQSLHVHAVVSIVGVTALGAASVAGSNVAIAIIIGVLWECVWYVLLQGQSVKVVPVMTPGGDGSQTSLQQTYRVIGRLFFANTDSIKEHFHPETDPPKVIIDLANSEIVDYTAMYTLNQLGRCYQRVNKELHIHMKLEDYEHYIHVADEGFGDSKSGATIKQVMPTFATQWIEGRVIQRDLQPDRFQCFEDNLKGLPGTYMTKTRPGKPGKLASVEVDGDYSWVVWPNEETTALSINGPKIEMKLPSGRIHTGVLVDGNIRWSDDDVWTRQTRSMQTLMNTMQFKQIRDKDVKEKEGGAEVASNHSAASACPSVSRGSPLAGESKESVAELPGAVPAGAGVASSSSAAFQRPSGAAASSGDSQPMPPPYDVPGGPLSPGRFDKAGRVGSKPPERPPSPPPNLPEGDLRVTAAVEEESPASDAEEEGGSESEESV
jgi:SulP family sulfate permease